MRTIKFETLLDTTSEPWLMVSNFTSVFPAGVTDFTSGMQEYITNKFYYRDICYNNVDRWLREFHQLIKDRAYVWKKLIETETALSDNQMLTNYDLTESAEYNRTSSGSSSSTLTPDLTTQQDDTRGTIDHQMDTPDGITDDIEHYLSTAIKTDETVSQTQTQTGTQKTESSDENEGKDTTSLHRYGNIGIQTAADILGGYRQAQIWDAYDAVIYPEVNRFFSNEIDFAEDL